MDAGHVILLRPNAVHAPDVEALERLVKLLIRTADLFDSRLEHGVSYLKRMPIAWTVYGDRRRHGRRNGGTSRRSNCSRIRSIVSITSKDSCNGMMELSERSSRRQGFTSPT